MRNHCSWHGELPVVTVITVKHVKPRPNSTPAGRVHTSETETQMQKTRSKQTVGEVFSQHDKGVLKLLFESSLSKLKTKDQNHARILILADKWRKNLSIILQIKEKNGGRSLLFSSLEDKESSSWQVQPQVYHGTSGELPATTEPWRPGKAHDSSCSLPKAGCTSAFRPPVLPEYWDTFNSPWYGVRVRVDGGGHLCTASLSQLLPALAENWRYTVPHELTFHGIPVTYLRSLAFFQSHPPNTISFLQHDKIHTHLWREFPPIE